MHATRLGKPELKNATVELKQFFLFFDGISIVLTQENCHVP